MFSPSFEVKNKFSLVKWSKNVRHRECWKERTGKGLGFSQLGNDLSLQFAIKLLVLAIVAGTESSKCSQFRDQGQWTPFHNGSVNHFALSRNNNLFKKNVSK